jgi:hypothetical protein
MAGAYQVIRELAQRALQACGGNWNTAERLIDQWLTADPALKQQLMAELLEFHIRHAITAEGRRQHQHEANLRRDALIAQEQAQETSHIVEEFLRHLDPQGPGADERP